ncbi:MAG: hypothetical protein GKR90_22995 [Pseudomonadales bacterium]|nr:hypothetical protein [Pseudomonadales bacterium]
MKFVFRTIVARITLARTVMLRIIMACVVPILTSTVWAETPPPATGIIFDESMTEEAPEASECLSARAVRSMEVVNEELVIVHGSHNRFWVNRLLHKCTGLTDDMLLKLEPWGGRFCKNSRFEARDRFHDGPYTVSCRWGKFEPAALEQVAMIKSELDES